MRIITACIVLLLTFLVVGCSAKKAKDCPVETLIIDESAFPEGTHPEELFSPVPDDPVNSAERSFYYEPDLAYEEIIRWNSIAAAKAHFKFMSKSVFDVDKYRGPWTLPSELTYKSPIADEYLVACGVDGGIYQCRMLSTYAQYFIFFRSYITEQGISISTFDQLLKAIDSKVAQCMNL